MLSVWVGGTQLDAVKTVCALACMHTKAVAAPMSDGRRNREGEEKGDKGSRGMGFMV